VRVKITPFDLVVRIILTSVGGKAALIYWVVVDYLFNQVVVKISLSDCLLAKITHVDWLVIKITLIDLLVVTITLIDWFAAKRLPLLIGLW